MNNLGNARHNLHKIDLRIVQHFPIADKHKVPPCYKRFTGDGSGGLQADCLLPLQQKTEWIKLSGGAPYLLIYQITLVTSSVGAACSVQAAAHRYYYFYFFYSRNLNLTASSAGILHTQIYKLTNSLSRPQNTV